MIRFGFYSIGALSGFAMLLSLLITSPAMAIDDPRPLRYLGIGGCRTASGGHGTFDLHKNVASLDQCRDLCGAARFCEAIEYNRVKRECEVHRAPITRLSDKGAGNTTCYTKSP